MSRDERVAYVESYKEARVGLQRLTEEPVNFFKLYLAFYMSLAKAGKSNAEAVKKAVNEIVGDNEKLVLPDMELALLSQYVLVFQVLMFNTFVPSQQKVLSAFQSPFNVFCKATVEGFEEPEFTTDAIAALEDGIKTNAQKVVVGG